MLGQVCQDFVGPKEIPILHPRYYAFALHTILQKLESPIAKVLKREVCRVHCKHLLPNLQLIWRSGL